MGTMQQSFLGINSKAELVLHLDAGNPLSYPGSGNTWYDISGFSNNGTLSGGAIYDSGNGGSISFNGAGSMVNCGTGNTLNLGNNYTIDTWINLTSYGQNNLGRILERTSGASSGYFFSVDNQNVSNGAQWWVNGSGIPQSLLSIYTLGNWINIGVRIMSSYFLYRNGAWIYNTGGGVPTSNPGASFIVGNRAAGDRSFNGKIAILKIYNKALTDAELLSNFNANKSRFGL